MTKENSCNEVSNAAGKACEPCENSKIKDSCISCINVTIKDPKKKENVTDIICGADRRNYTLVDKSYGVEILYAKELKFNIKTEKTRNTFKIGTDKSSPKTIDIKINGKCSINDNECPRGKFYPVGGKKAEEVNKELKDYKLTYDTKTNLEVLLDPYEWGMSFLKRVAPGMGVLFKGKSTYYLQVVKTHRNIGGVFDFENGKIRIDDLFLKSRPITIDVLPYFEFKVGLGFTSKTDGYKQTDNQRKAEARVNNTGRDVIKGSKKQIRKSQKGWDKIDPNIKIKTNRFRFGGEATIGKNTFSYEKENAYAYLNDVGKRLENIGKLGTFLSVLTDVSDKGKKGGKLDKPICKSELSPTDINIHASAKYENSDDYKSSGIDWEFAIGARPLIGGKITIDLLQVLATYFKLEKLIGKLRGLLEDGKNGNSLSLKCDLSLEAGFEFGVVFEKKHDKDNVTSELDDTGVYVKPGFILDIRGEVDAWIASGAFIATGKVECEMKFHIRKNDQEKFEIYFFHDGVRLLFEASSKGGWGANNSLESLDGQKPDIEGEWFIYDKIEEGNAKVLATF